MAITSEQLEQACFSLISFSGAAKSDYLEAVEHAKKGDFEAAEQAVSRGNEEYLHAHEAHFDLIQEEVSSDEGLLTRLTLVHAEDQLAMAETTRLFAEQIIELYRRLA
ncbi:PTS lactose/cellobiose transporter subunit IIA [Agathobaculum sp.]|uniref:PTS lactose/cellobiose transporter subunit IIA n=1 Tax=Agathobaculum sp. TaxID=2048138 RepID=UPI002A80C187|nr:PTS lactose/cellobiose transporter subunit IIA [Agathobaculum sp.]MDY3617661.1 PTS lactose/cellobiose transporter subunit IIA [Agathobaculum sp.]